MPGTDRFSQEPERAVLVCLSPPDAGGGDVARNELSALVSAAGANPVMVITGSTSRVAARYFVGKGKLQEIREACDREAAHVVVFNHMLSPAQERNLEQALRTRVLDRTGLILDIFAQRARSFEGKLQVELAQLRHMSTRLVRGWTHLERQKGGIGLRGPGETQLETDRRLLAKRIIYLTERLKRVRKQREQGRSHRFQNRIPTVGLVGYTNAGKTTLFNALTDSSAFSADQLFATLDPLYRQMDVPGVGAVVLVDTVGFVRDLPHELVEAFQATLIESRDADLLLHVIDASDPERDERRRVVNGVLADIGAQTVPQIEVYNKIDLTDREAQVHHVSGERPARAYVSASALIGLEDLRELTGQSLDRPTQPMSLELTPTEGRLRAKLFEMQAVVSDAPSKDGGWKMTVQLGRSAWERLLRDHAHRGSLP